MSADNMIYIQKRKGRWWVWMGFASNKKTRKPIQAEVFETEAEARAYAEGWYRGEDVVEYGIITLPPKGE